MLYLLDTNAIRDLLDQNLRATERLARELPSNRIAVSVTVRGEVLFGIERLPAGKRRDGVAQATAAFFATIDSEPIPVAAAQQYAHIKRIREERGVPMDENDLWLAATAGALGATLVTRDTDFQNVPGIAVEDWTV